MVVGSKPMTKSFRDLCRRVVRLTLFFGAILLIAAKSMLMAKILSHQGDVQIFLGWAGAVAFITSFGFGGFTFILNGTRSG